MKKFVFLARSRWFLLFLGTVISMPVLSFPPAPHHRIFGTVRDEFGYPLNAGPAIVYLETEAGIASYGSVVHGIAGDRNYQLSIPMDAGRTLERYQPTAQRPWVGFKLWVQIGETVYLPIEMRGELSQLGKPSESTRIDLTLGEDSDGDGLPDAWELANGGSLDALAPGEDGDGDGLSNLDEYLAGTHASDKENVLDLAIEDISGGSPRLSFTATRGRTYQLQGSADLSQWQAIPFSLSREEEPQWRHTSDTTTPIIIHPSDESGALRFFRLVVTLNPVQAP